MRYYFYVWLRTLLIIFISGQIQADLFSDLFWVPNDNKCRGIYEPLSDSIKTLPENQTIIQTDGRSEFLLGQEAAMRDVTVFQNGIRINSKKTRLIVDDNNDLKQIFFIKDTTYQDKDFLVNANNGQYKVAQDKLFLNNLNYRLGSLSQTAWGKANGLNRGQDKIYHLDNISISFCAPSHPTWSFASEKMIYDPQERFIGLDNPSLVLNGSDLIKFPYLSFITSGRKSGLLKPEVNYTKEYGFLYKQFYYFNLAPAYDLVVAPMIFSKGSLGLYGLYRYLTPTTQGKLGSEMIWDDRSSDRRFQINWDQQFVPWEGGLLDINMTRFSDSKWFRDFGNTFFTLDTLHPVEKASASQSFSWGEFYANVIKYKNDFVSESSVIPNSEVFRIIPMNKTINRNWSFSHDYQAGHYYNIQSSNQGSFDNDINRLVGNFTLQQRIQRPYGYIQNKFGEIVRYYNSKDVKTEVSTIPSFSAEGALFFVKPTRDSYQTLTPKVYYVYVPYRSQYDLPSIDSSIKSDNSLNSLFSRRRFVGSDRIGDENAFVLSLSTMYNRENSVYEFEIGKQFNVESPRLCLNQDCDDDSHIYNPLIFNMKGNGDLFSLSANANYDTSLKDFRNIGAELNFKDFLSSDWLIRYAMDLRQQDDASGNKTDYLSRLGVKQTWYATEFLTLNGTVFKDFQDDKFFSFELGSNYDTCCWTSNINVGRRYIGETSSADATKDDYQWYATFELFLKGFSSNPVVTVTTNKGKEILASV